jgi:mannose-6-phosphate isomerase-like protein (cupin superfamily)
MARSLLAVLIFAGACAAIGPGAGIRTPEPVQGALPGVEGAPPLSQRASCSTATCVHASLVPEDRWLETAPAAPTVVWDQRVAAGAQVAFPRHHGVDLLGVVVEGRARIVIPDATPLEVRGWHAFRAAGAGLTLRAVEPTRLVLAVTSFPAGLAAAVAALRRDPASVWWTQRPGPLLRADLRAARDFVWGGGAYHARIAFEGPDSPRSSVGVLLLSRSAPVAEHVHPREWEQLAVLEGDGDLLLGDRGQRTRVRVRAGSLVRVSPGTAHAWRPRKTAPLVAVQIYTPPGPEQRFKKLAGAAD